MFAQAVISADRRYVRITPSPSFSTIGEVQTFNFATGQGGQQQGGAGAGGGCGSVAVWAAVAVGGWAAAWAAVAASAVASKAERCRIQTYDGRPRPSNAVSQTTSPCRQSSR